ncbi:MAG: helix-turn-helix domain-containing protein [Nocardioides sp.]|uniref:helix-turn-helix domain-containing protein n=1 Tax=Nocardioides sp. TaxID=35761 RepID=UPI0039E5F96F
MALSVFADVVPENSIRFRGHETHSHLEPHLLHAAAGSSRLLVDGEPVLLREKESIWLAGQVPHAAKVAEGGILLGPTLPPQVEPPERFRLLGVVPAISEIMTASLMASPSTSAQVRPFREALSAVLTRLGRHYFATPMPTHATVRLLARDAVRSRLTLDQLAREHHISARQAQRIFLDETGLAFATWRTRARLNLAIDRLIAGRPIAEAARAAGYRSRAGFLRALSREAGIPVEALAERPLTALRAHWPAA